MVKHLVMLVSLSLVNLASTALADTPACPGLTPAVTPSPAPAVPALHHAPIVTARVSSDITVAALIDRPDRLKRALLLFHGGGTRGEVEFERSSQGNVGYVAVIPAAAVRGDLTYAIELETTSGEHLQVFASRAEPHHVSVLDTPDDRREAALLARLKGRRSVVQTSGEYASFGSGTSLNPQPQVPGRAATPTKPDAPDRFYRIEATYTYRLLGTVSEFGLRAGVVRGHSLVQGETDPDKLDVGLNYGAPRLRVRLADWVHVEGELLTSVTEVGFAVGGGGALLLGDPYGSKLVLGFEGVHVFGARGYSRLDLVASSRFTVSPIIEVTTMPHADRAGVRLLGEVGVEVGHGFRLDLRGGYQARTFNRGGPTLGGGVAYAF